MTTSRVLICEDSRTFAVALQRLLEHDGDIRVAGICTTAEQAISAVARLKPDLVTMDIELPGMSGLEAVEELMSSSPVPILVLSGQGRASDNVAAALAAGALEVLAKEDLEFGEPASTAAVAFRRRVKLLSRVRVIRHPRARLRAQPGVRGPARRASVIGICASTGGPHILAGLLDAFPADYPIPILVVQHIAAGFTEGLARSLDRAVALPVGIAEERVRARQGVWIAPEDAHLKVSFTGHLHLDRRTVVGPHRPSGDILFESIAVVAGKAGVAVVLSGMGSDGAAGAAAVQRSGGLAIAQDRASSAVYGMPKAAFDHGVQFVLPPSGIAGLLLGLCHQPLAGAR